METHTTKWSAKQIKSMIEKGTILFDHPIQRGDDQWNNQRKSNLIHSLIIGLPIPPVFYLRHHEKWEGVEKPVSIRQTMDGKQRQTTIYKYLNNEFSLEEYPPVHINGETFDVSGKKFDELDEEVQDTLLGAGVPSYTIDRDLSTNEEIEMMFFRMNDSKPLTVAQKSKALVGIEFSTLLNDVSVHTTILELSGFAAGQIKGNIHQQAIMQTMMLIEDFEFKKFSSAEVARYASTFKDDFDNKAEILSKVEQALDYLNECFTKREKLLLKPINFPMTVHLAYQAALEGIEPDHFTLWSQAFTDALTGEVEVNISTDYLDYCGAGSTDLSKVFGRVNAMRKHFDKYMAYLSKKEVEEEPQQV